ncbi:hypothetical protein A9Q83_01585 [Alphaproteobacteria bacterium 46_93_T64]|nr:hypothetical protein A9Q83_01585 [Alphaproteobacteria bacterium 46_93_T64]
MISKNGFFKIVFALIMPIFASGCANIVSQSTPTEFYRLIDATDQQLALKAMSFSDDIQIGVGPITIPGYADRPQIVSSGSGGRLMVDDFNHWAEPVQENIERIMVSNISSLLSEKQVFHYPANFHPAPSSIQVAVEIREMIRDESGAVFLSASWNVKRMLDNKLLVRNAVKYKSSQSASGFSEYTLALSALFGKLSSDIMQSVHSVSN